HGGGRHHGDLAGHGGQQRRRFSPVIGKRRSLRLFAALCLPARRRRNRGRVAACARFCRRRPNRRHPRRQSVRKGHRGGLRCFCHPGRGGPPVVGRGS